MRYFLYGIILSWGMYARAQNVTVHCVRLPYSSTAYQLEICIEKLPTNTMIIFHLDGKRLSLEMCEDRIRNFLIQNSAEYESCSREDIRGFLNNSLSFGVRKNIMRYSGSNSIVTHNR